MTPPLVGDFRDRSTGLLLFGIFEIVIGAACLLMAVIVILGGLVAAGQPGALPMRLILPGIGVYFLLGAGSICLGIGSVHARRWARALWLCLSGIALATAVVSVPFATVMIIRLPRLMTAPGQPALPPVAILITQIVTAVFMAAIYLGIPGALFLFYRSRHVRRTCEVRNPVECWTDRCPLPVLGLAVYTMLAAAGLLSLLAFGGVFPLFGAFATGIPGGALILMASTALALLARGIYRLDPRALWGLFVFMVALGTSGTLTVWNSDIATLYAQMGFSSQMAGMAAAMAQWDTIKWMTPLSLVPWIVWPFWVNRYFSGARVS